MSEWTKREAAFEKALEVDSELRFRSLARRNRLLGLWAAEKLGLNEAAAQAYAMKLVEDQIGTDDDDALARWLAQELGNVNPPVSDHRIHRRIGELTAIAAREVFEGR